MGSLLISAHLSVHKLMSSDELLMFEGLLTNETLEWPFISMSQLMFSDRPPIFKSLVTFGAFKWSLITVGSEMDSKLTI